MNLDFYNTNKVIGYNIRKERTKQRVSLTELSSALGLRSSDMHKIEMGMSPISAAKLCVVSTKLKKPVWKFYNENNLE